MAGNIKGITIEIDGNTTKFDRAIKDSNKEVNALNKELKNIDSSLKFNPGNVELLSQKQELLKQKTQAAKEKLEALKAAQADVEQQFANGEIDQGQYNKFQQEVIKAESQVKTFNDQLKDTQKELKGLQGFEGAMNKNGDGFQKAGDKMTKVGGEMSKKLTAPIVAIGTAAGAAWKGIDDALDTIVTKTGATGDAMKEFEGNFRNVFTSMPVDAQQVGDAIGELNTQFGLTGTALEQASTQMIQFAEINGADITNSTIAAKKAMEQFGASTEELPGFLDTVTAAAQQTGQSTDSIFEAVRKGAPQLKQMGLGLNESALLMAKFEQSGLDSTKAIGALTKAQVTFAKDGKTLKEGMSEFFKTVEQGGDSVDVINQASEIFGSKNGPLMVDAIKNGIVSLDDFTASGEDFAGTVAQTFEGTIDPIDQFKTAMNNLKMLGADVFTSIQEAAAPVLEALVEKLKSLSNAWKNLSPETQQTIVKVGLIVAAVGPMLVILGKITSGIGAVIKAIGALSSPIGLVAVAVGAAVILIIKHWDEIKAAWESTKKFLVDTWNSIKEEAEKIWTPIKEFFETTWTAIKTVAETTWNGIKTFLETIWKGIKTVCETIWNGIKLYYETMWKIVSTLFTTVWNGIKTTLETVWNTLKSTAETVWNSIKDSIIKPISDAAQSVWDKAKEMARNFVNAVTHLPQEIGNIFKNIYESVKNWMDKAISKIGEFFGFKSKAERESGSGGGGSAYPPKTKRSGAGPARSYRSAVDVTGVSWYDKGGIFKSPQVIGVGEKRPEFVGALDDLRKIFREEAGKGYTIKIDKLEVREEADIDKIARKLYELQKREARGRALC